MRGDFTFENFARKFSIRPKEIMGLFPAHPVTKKLGRPQYDFFEKE